MPRATLQAMHRVTRRQSIRLLGAAALASGIARAETSSSAALTRSIPSTGEALPVIGLGTWQTFDVGSSTEKRTALEEILRTFSELGGKLIDSSPMYGTSEETAGDIAGNLDLRDKLFVATKVWTSGKEQGIRQMEDSMRKLRAKPIDLMQVHNLLDVHTHLDTLRGWKKEGIIRYLGVTHYHASRHDEVAKVMENTPLDFIQINYSVAESEAEKRILPLAAEKGIAVIANRPFAGGNVFARLRERPLPPWAAEIECSSWAQLMLKYITSHPAITVAIPATSRVAHLRDNMAAGRLPLPDESMRKKIREAIA